ncbi:MAG: ribonuclease J [Rhodospirillaceae bacterium]|nr:ribonuclease J [Rhodospirillaceae bacterium]
MIPGKDELLFLPLGGAGEIGMNLNLYGHDGRWLAIDCGVTFGDDTTPGIDVMMPDPAFIAERRESLVGLVLTHAHEDHLGAVPYLWPRLKCTVYATPFAANVLRRKLKETPLHGKVPIVELPMSGHVSLPPFDLELVTLTHSIPEPNAVVIRTKLGTVLHTGDWKLDPEPLVGPLTDEAALRKLGDEGVLAMVCDSTNALVPGASGSEAEVREGLMKLVAGRTGRVAVACFASNIARLETASVVAAAHNRNAGLVGRSLYKMEEAARETGYLKNLPPFVDEHDLDFLPRDSVLMLCTGSQGEPRSALARIARGQHPHARLEPGDTVIFSSRVIPGNERSIGRLQDDLAKLGVDVITTRDAFVHVSGHPARDELATMYQWVRPKIAVPVHGEHRHMRAHAALAEECQVPQAAVVENGQILRLAPGPAEIIAEVPSGRLVLDGTSLVPLSGELMRARSRLATSGAVIATLVVDRAGKLMTNPQISAHGLVDPGGDNQLQERVTEAIREAIEDMDSAGRSNDDALAEAVRRGVRRAVNAAHGKKPMTDIHVVRVK